LAPANPFYNIFQAVRFGQAVDVELLERSLNEIVRRHEALRTRFVAEEGQPVQVILARLNLTVGQVDLRTLGPGAREAEARRLAGEEARRPFVLAEGPLLRATLVRLADADCLLLLSMHHIVSDGWSMGVFFGELRALYAAYAAGLASPLPELPIQYADYALWQREWLQGERLEAQVRYWRGRLADLPRLELPTDRQRPAVASYRGAHEAVELDATLSAAIKRLSQQEGATLFMTLLAAFAVLLQRYTGQQEIVIGTPVAGRNWRETEQLVGFFVNTLVLRLELGGEPSYRELLGRVKRAALEAYEHQDLPFEKLVEELQPERDLSRNPLFQVTFQFFQTERISPEAPTFAASGIEFLDAERGTAKFDLTLDMWESGGRLRGRLEYSTDLFEAATIRRLAGHFQTLLRSITAEPERPVGRLELLTGAEREQLLVSWNATGTDYPRQLCVHQWFERQTAHRPEALAVACGAEALSYGQLNARANRLAHRLRVLGVRPEALVAVCLERSVGLATAVLAVWKAGGAYVPLDPLWPPERLGRLLRELRPAAVLSTAAGVPRLPAGLEPAVVRVDPPIAEEGIATDEDPEGATNPCSGVTPANLAYVIYTSGSTGTPKGVMIEHAALANHNLAIARQFGLQPIDRVFQFAFPTFDVALEEIFPALQVGAAVVLCKSRHVPSLDDLLLEVRTSQLTVLNLPTSLWCEWTQTLRETGQVWPVSLRLVIIGSEQVQPHHLANWCGEQSSPLTLLNAYGTTETTITSLICPLPASSSNVPIGRPIANAEVYVLDRWLQPVPMGVAGELYIGGAGLGRGYLQGPALTAGRFIAHPFSPKPGARLYRSGDRVRYRTDGQLEFLGRADDQLKLRGYRVEPGEVEAVLGQHPAVSQCVVVAQAGPGGDPRLVAYVIPKKGQSISCSELQHFARTHIPNYMVPSAFIALSSLPVRKNGKLDRAALPKLESSAFVAKSLEVAAHTELERELVRLWLEVLGVEKVGLDDNFFDLGGHSLLMVRVHPGVCILANRTISIIDLFAYPTIRSLARYLSDPTPQQPTFQHLQDRADKRRVTVKHHRAADS
jgi:amino acid adenylation domain-containing protein